jgi:acetolactate synthase-1/2/3 large subunit
MIKVSDLVSRFLAAKGIQDIFLVSGGGIMHLLESVGRQEGLRYWCNYHEQACAGAAEAWAKVNRRPCACLVTVGPGGLNALSGAAGAWVDSVPMLILTGQVRRDLMADFSRQRQKGPQEGDLVGLAGHITKYAATLQDPAQVLFELEKAWHLATSGRPGPVLIDFPLDVQGAMVEEAALPVYVPPCSDGNPGLAGAAAEAAAWIRASRRPVLLAGNGVGWSGAGEALLQLLERTGIPTLLTHTAKDLLWETHDQYLGCSGPLGQRRANFALQSADLLLSLGSGLCVAKSGFNVAGFSPRSRKIMVDIDPAQLHQHPFQPDLAIAADAGAFIQALLQALGPDGYRPPANWLAACAEWKARFPTVEPEHLAPSDQVNTYRFMDRLSDHLQATDTLVTGNGMDVVSYIQSFRIKRGQRALQNGNWGAMGWDLPLAVGAAVARQARVILVTGDGSFQWNVQELLTVGSHRLPVCIFIFNNQGYATIRATQTAYFQGHFVGAEAASGVANPDFRHLAQAYGLAYDRIDPAEDLDAALARVLAGTLPRLCEVPVAPDQPISPKASSFRRPDGTMESRPLEDMAPFLPREEVQAIMGRFDPADGTE